MTGKTYTLSITADTAGLRLDHLKPSGAPALSRARFQALIRSGLVMVNNISVKPSYILKEDDQVVFTIPDPEKLRISAQELPIRILYEDSDIVVINKPRGMVVHPGAGINENTVVNALLYHCRDLSGIGGVTRPGIVHRLDKGTSGVMIAAKNDTSHLSLSAQFSSRSMGKKYLALIQGVPDWKEHELNAPIGRHPHHRVKMSVSGSGKRAKTIFRLLAYSDEGSLVAAIPSSGRTHQIRVHLDYLGFPILGDPLYGSTKHRKISSTLRQALKGMDGFCLHAETLIFKHPVSGDTMTIHASIPDDFRLVMNVLHINYHGE